ncbi:MAG: hypothetical protein RLZZ609_2040 [Cyanobacteriota bacterium]
MLECLGGCAQVGSLPPVRRDVGIDAFVLTGPCVVLTPVIRLRDLVITVAGRLAVPQALHKQIAVRIKVAAAELTDAAVVRFLREETTPLQ